MADCECRFVPPVEAHSFTGPTTSKIVCDVNSHTGIKHLVVVTNKGGYPLEIYVSARISEPNRVKFSDCPDFRLPEKRFITDDFWQSAVILGVMENYTFGVFLSSDAPNGSKQGSQRIDIKVSSKRPQDSVDQARSNHLTVIA